MKFYSLFLAFSFLSLFGCSSSSNDCECGEIDFPNQLQEIDGTVYKKSVLDCRLPKLQTFEFNSYQGAEIKAAHGTIFTIMPNIFFETDGTPVDGTIQFSILEMYNPGEIIACQLSTNGVNNEQSVEPLLSESIFFIEAKYNGNPVIVEGEFQVFVPSENRDLELSLFHSPSCNELECEVLWEMLPRSNVFDEPYTDASGVVYFGYRSFLTNLGWFSMARFNDSQNPRGIIYNKTLSSYNLSNSNVFFLYKTSSTAVGKFLEYDEINAVFSEKFHEIPNETSGNVIFVSKPDANFNFEANQMITEDGKISVTRQPQLGSENDLIDYINNL